MVDTERLLRICKRLTLLTDPEDDRLYGCYIDESSVYNGKVQRTVRAKGSTLALIEDARQALKDAGWDEDPQ